MLYEFARSLFFKLDPETAHAVVMNAIDPAAALNLFKLVGADSVRDPRTVMGLTFPNAVGLAAGLDKSGSHVSALGKTGFGHIEVGTFTPRPQPGNPAPRLWRLIPAQGIVNHMGFNNCGVRAGIENLKSADAFRAAGGILGINIGKQNSTAVEDALPDYRVCMDTVYQKADYLAIDISCPNTPGLTKLQEGDSLVELVRGIEDERMRLSDKHGRRVPITVKIGPDLSDDALRAAADAFVECGMDAITATNTTTQRPGVEHLLKPEMCGGLSGLPLNALSTKVIRTLSEHLKGELPIIASGGVMSPEIAAEKMEAGASLVQIYSGFIYSGPALAGQCAKVIRDRFPAK